MSDDGRYLGVLSAHEVMNALAAGRSITVGALAVDTDPVTPDTPLGDVLDRLDHGAGVVPVVDSAGAVSGWIRHRDLLGSLTAG